MSGDEREIANLISAVSEARDQGDFATMAELFAHASFQTHYPAGYPGVGLTRDEYADRPGGGHGVQQGTDQVREIFTRLTKLYDGKPRTHYVVSNLVVVVADDRRTAEAKSYYTAFQAAPGFALQPIAAGRYHDRFERVGGRWRFTAREIYADLSGDLSHHMTLDPIEYGRRFGAGQPTDR
jgi:hypothetical protein